jgi:hypothetical protein
MKLRHRCSDLIIQLLDYRASYSIICECGSPGGAPLIASLICLGTFAVSEPGSWEEQASISFRPEPHSHQCLPQQPLGLPQCTPVMFKRAPRHNSAYATLSKSLKGRI